MASMESGSHDDILVWLSCYPAMGEGLLPILEKLAQKIIRLEFIEIRELMPEMVLHDKGIVNRNNFEWNKEQLFTGDKICNECL